jgi:chitosanase
MLTPLQKLTAQAIVNIFETGRVRGDYGRVVCHPDDPGHLTYGRSQTTLASGNLFLLAKDYCEAADAAHAEPLGAYLPRLEACDLSLDHDMGLRALLARCGEDPAMCRVQDGFFDRVYWQPAVKRAADLGIASALGTTVVYDSAVHGSFQRIRDRTTAALGTPQGAGERAWIARYIAERRAWLANHGNALLRKTVYRMDELGTLVDRRKWGLPLPLRVRGLEIGEAALAGEREPVLASASEDRLLRLREPPMRGDDVRALQQALTDAGFMLRVDGIFGRQTDRRVRTFQKAQGLKADGIVGPVTRAHLGL